MSDDLRARFISRISSVGWGARESVQTVLHSVVNELRTRITDGGFTDEELPQAIAFHDAAERLWRDTLASDPPMSAKTLRAELDRLVGECSGALLGSLPVLERAREHARALEMMHRAREDADET